MWKQTIQNIRETILTEWWNDEDWKINQTKERILQCLQLKQSMTNKTQCKPKTREVEEISTYRHPPQGFVKLNFDGATKGNMGIGGLFNNDGGTTLRIYAMDCGEATKNEAELHTLKRGVKISIWEKYQNL